MIIKTITCHDVYNLGASLQAYALTAYLRSCGHEAQIIDYKPDYLSRHYSLSWVPNPKFDRPLLRQAYLMAKLPGRLEARKGLRKQRFDAFRQEFLPLTERRYESAEVLRRDCPEADLYIAGSDQIWNPVFQNGRDPAFFLEFVPEDRRKISYAASFSVDSLTGEDRKRMRPWLERLDAISVRETSAVALLKSMELDGIPVMDPVFLLEPAQWEQIGICPDRSGYILVYDFDASRRIREIAMALADRTGREIISVFPMEGASEVWADMGPREFLGAIRNADYVISNSFHATAFSLIFHKQFYVINREEKINTRMRDLLAAVSMDGRLISALPEVMTEPDWSAAQDRIDKLISGSKYYLEKNLI